MLVGTFFIAVNDKHPMISRPVLLLAAGLLLLVIPALAVTVPLGDTLPLTGSAPGADSVYLFLTGPNLPPDGVKLDDISVPVVTGDPSTVVQVPVDASGTWEYTWYTRTTGGLLDAGTYTISVVTKPVGRRDLAQSDGYATISVTLTPPTLAILPGGITISSEPSGAQVWMDGTLAGSTPLTLTNVTEGDHAVEIRKEGFEPVLENVTVTGGENATVESVLAPGSGTRTPAETIPGTPRAAPTRIPFPIAALLIGLAGLAVFLRFR